MIDPECQRIVESACARIVSNVLDFAVLVHPVPWSAQLEEEIQGMLMEEFAGIIATNREVAAAADLDQVRTVMAAAFHDRLALLSTSAETIGSA